MTNPLTYQELAALMKKGAGVTVDPTEMESFYRFRLRRVRSGLARPPRHRGCAGEPARPGAPRRRGPLQDPREFLDLVNNTLVTGA